VPGESERGIMSVHIKKDRQTDRKRQADGGGKQGARGL